jgi:short-subunit dehydrogenase
MFDGKRIIINGASAGIGAELAVTLSKQGARVVLGARTQKALDAVVAR